MTAEGSLTMSGCDAHYHKSTQDHCGAPTGSQIPEAQAGGTGWEHYLSHALCAASRSFKSTFHKIMVIVLCNYPGRFKKCMYFDEN